MELPNTLPCKCMNPRCGISFYAMNPVGGSGGLNNVFSGNMTNCPQCGQMAIYADWSTDNKGNFHIKDIFNFVNEFKDIEKLKLLKTNLKAVNNTYTHKELTSTLVKVDSNFQKYENVLKSLSSDNIKYFIATLIAMATLLMSYQALVMTDKNHAEDINLERAKFEYQKQQDKSNQARASKHHDEIMNLEHKKLEYQKQQDKKSQANKIKKEKEAITKKIKALELKFELLTREKNIPRVQQVKNTRNEKPRGSYRNKPCKCGSGLKAKHCYINNHIS